MIKRLKRMLEARKNKLLAHKIEKYNTPIKLHIGCGRNYKEGWINIDSNPDVRLDVMHDLSQGIPCFDNSVDYIYSEHFIEHLTYDEGFAFINEAFRVLKPSGVLRIACPDLDVLIKSYIDDTWREMEWVKLINAYWYPSRGYMLNQCMIEDGFHKYIYNKEDLIRRLTEAGFVPNNIFVQEVNLSKFKHLENIEKRKDSMVIEAQK